MGCQSTAVKFEKRNGKKWFIDEYDPNNVVLFQVEKTHLIRRTSFQEVAIIELRGYGKALIIDGMTQSSVSDEHVYHEALIHPPVLFFPARRKLKILILGAGEGATMRELLKHKNVIEITAVDIDAEAVQIFKEHLPEMHRGSFDDPKVSLVIESAEKYLQRSKAKFDVIYSDISDPSFFNLGSDREENELAFYEMAEKNLARDGIFVSHAYHLNENINDEHLAMREKLKKFFRFVISGRIHVPFFQDYWGLIFAYNRVHDAPFLLTESQFKRSIKNRKLEDKLFYLNAETYRALFAFSPLMKKKLGI